MNPVLIVKPDISILCEAISQAADITVFTKALNILTIKAPRRRILDFLYRSLVREKEKHAN